VTTPVCRSGSRRRRHHSEDIPCGRKTHRVKVSSSYFRPCGRSGTPAAFKTFKTVVRPNPSLATIRRQLIPVVQRSITWAGGDAPLRDARYHTIVPTGHIEGYQRKWPPETSLGPFFWPLRTDLGTPSRRSPCRGGSRQPQTLAYWIRGDLAKSCRSIAAAPTA
jgi:hypothetical protein